MNPFIRMTIFRKKKKKGPFADLSDLLKDPMPDPHKPSAHLIKAFIDAANKEKPSVHAVLTALALLCELTVIESTMSPEEKVAAIDIFLKMMADTRKTFEKELPRSDKDRVYK